MSVMKALVSGTVFFVGILAFGNLGCGDEDAEPVDLSHIGMESVHSECDGFRVGPGSSRHDDSEEECTGTWLLWHYLPESQTIKFLLEDVLLNCCGDHTIVASVESDPAQLKLTIPDATNCACLCLFDASLGVQGVAEPVVKITLKQDFHDNDVMSDEILWSGELDLEDGSGTILVKEKADVAYCD